LEFTGQNQNFYQRAQKKTKRQEQSKWLNLPSAEIVLIVDTPKKKEFHAGFG
jgi:hypothetical protein